MTQIAELAQALLILALTWGTPVVAVIVVMAFVQQGPRHTVEAATRPDRLRTKHWTKRSALARARARTERTGIQFSVVTEIRVG